MTDSQVPPKQREEWKKMITGDITHEYRNFVLQLQLNQARKDVQGRKMSIEDAVHKIYTLCEKYQLAVRPDLLIIFKTW